MFDRSRIHPSTAPRNTEKQNTAGIFLRDNRTAAKAAQLKPASPVVQLAKKNRTAHTLGGSVGLGITGAIVGSYVPVVGTLLGGVAGLVAGAIGGYWYSGPKTYGNLQKKEYQQELRVLEEYRNLYRNATNDYTKGTIVKYSGTNEQKFLGMLAHGGVLYTYDVNNQLSIGSGVSAMKHAIVAGNKNVKAAGWAKPQASKTQSSQQMYEYYIQKIEHYSKLLEESKGPGLSVMKKYGFERPGQLDSIPKENESDRDLLAEYKIATEQLQYATEQAEIYRLHDREQAGVTKRTPIQLDNESGHYHPGADSKDEAFEGWKAAGFHNLSWKPWQPKKTK